MSKKNETIRLITSFEVLFSAANDRCSCYWYGRRIEAEIIIMFSAKDIQEAIEGDKLLKIIKL